MISNKSLRWYLSISSLALGSCVIFVMIWLINPSRWTKSSTDTQEWLDIMVMMDVSKSMQVMDIDTNNRLDASKRALWNFVSSESQHRYGLGVFAGESVGISPLTSDTDLFLTFLWWVDHHNLSQQGTDLVWALEFGLSRYGTGDESSGRVLLIISDGWEDEIQLSDSIIQQVGDMWVYVTTIWVGTRAGGPIPDRRDAFGNISWKLYNGETVISKYNPDWLQQLAKRLDGSFVRLEDESDISKIQKSLARLDTKAISKDITNKRYIGRWFVGIWLIMFIVYLISLLFPEYYIWKN